MSSWPSTINPPNRSLCGTVMVLNFSPQFVWKSDMPAQSSGFPSLTLISSFLTTGLGYHRDPQTRAAFMEVLTKILQQGTEFETLAETALADRFI